MIGLITLAQTSAVVIKLPDKPLCSVHCRKNSSETPRRVVGTSEPAGSLPTIAIICMAPWLPEREMGDSAWEMRTDGRDGRRVARPDMLNELQISVSLPPLLRFLRACCSSCVATARDCCCSCVLRFFFLFLSRRLLSFSDAVAGDQLFRSRRTL